MDLAGVSGPTRQAGSLVGRSRYDGDTGCCENHGAHNEKNETSEADAARELVRMAKEQGLSLTGPDGLGEDADQDRHRDGLGRGND